MPQPKHIVRLPPLPDPATLEDDIRKYFAKCVEKLGLIPYVLRAYTANADKFRAFSRFYNTLMANCTNMLATIVNTHYPGTLPRHYSWILTGYSDTYLMREGFIELVDANEARTQHRYNLTPHKESIGYAGLLDPYAFSKVLRITLATEE